MHPAVPALALNRAPSHHRLACIPTPKAGGWHVAHYVICPLDQSTGGAHFFPALKKKGGKGERDRGVQESVRGGREENRRTRVGKRRRWRGAGREGRRARESGSALPPKPVADQSPYVKRHFLWAPLGRPVCVIKIDLSPLLFFFKRARAWEREGMTAGKSEKRAGRATDREREARDA